MDIRYSCNQKDFKRYTTEEMRDEMLITGPSTGVMYVTPTEIHGDHGPVQKAMKGTRVSIAVPAKVRPSDKLFKLVKVE